MVIALIIVALIVLAVLFFPILAPIFIGALCGWIASKLFKGKSFGFWINCIIGIVGGWVGNWLLVDTLGLGFLKGTIGGIVAAVVGAIILLWVISLIRKK